MSSIRSLLQDADPVRHEAPLPEGVREQLRATILRTVPADRSSGPVRVRLTLAAMFALAIVGALALGRSMWVHGTPRVLAAVRFEMRLAEDQPIPGLVVAAIRESGRVVYLHPEIVVSNDDIAQSWVSQDGPDRF